MLRNYLLTALRNIRRQPGFSAINIVGLALGLGCCLLIGLFVRDELSHDRFHEHRDRIVRIVADFTAPGAQTDHIARSSRPMAPTLRERYPEVETAVQLVPTEPTLKVEGESLRGFQGFYAEPSFFDIFTFPLVSGDAGTALAEPYAAILTESAARRMFGDVDVLGRGFAIQDTVAMRVTGVARDVPARSHLEFDVLFSYATREALIPPPTEAQWLQLDHYAYALLRDGVDAAAFSASVSDLPQVEYGSVLEAYGFSMAMELEPLASIYLHSQRQAQIGPTSDGRRVSLFAAIALFVLLIACVNYMNLATARSLQRAREVGVRKTLGSSRGSLAGQFLGESVLTAVFALLLALGLVAAVLPLFNEVAGKDLGFAALFDPVGVAVLLGLILVVGLGAGSYPAAVLSHFAPAHVLKGDFRTSAHGARLRQGLVVVQFAVSVALIAGTLVVVEQHRFMRERDAGFDREHMLVVDSRAVTTSERVRRAETIRQSLLAIPGVTHVTASATTPGRQMPLLLTIAEGLDEGDGRRMTYVFADHDYAETYGLVLVAGRYMSRDFETDAAEAALLNESAVAALGWTVDEAPGRWVHMGDQRRTVVGVVRDYHHLSLHRRVEPMVLMAIPSAHHQITLRLEPGALPDAVEQVRSAWGELFPGQPFEYAFVDETFDQQYQGEARLATIVGTFAGLAVLIASLGLFGLAAFMTAQRRQEIGVRRVLGASAASVVVLLSRRFAALVVLGFALGAPVAFLAMQHWLEGFAYRTALGPGVFLGAALLALAIAIASVSGQAIRAASGDPVEALRAE